MKKLIKTLSVILIIFLSIGCNYVRNNKQPKALTEHKLGTKVLIEDYTGHKCGVCPPAAEFLLYLKNKYPNQVIPLAIHAGFFATVDPAYPTDLRSLSGNDFDSQFAVSLAGNPNGLINRSGYQTGNFIKSFTSWESEFLNESEKPAKFDLKIKCKYDSLSNGIDVNVKIKSLANNFGIFKLVLLITEDSIIAEQKDYRLPSGQQKNSNYVFNHVLRDAINSTWGDLVFTNGSSLNDSVSLSYTNYKLQNNFNSKMCHIIGYIYDSDVLSPNRYKILQVEEIGL